jgi:hypothetical protein
MESQYIKYLKNQEVEKSHWKTSKNDDSNIYIYHLNN